MSFGHISSLSKIQIAPMRDNFWHGTIALRRHQKQRNVIVMVTYKSISVDIEALPGVLGNRGIMSFISGEQENTSLKIKGTGEQR